MCHKCLTDPDLIEPYEVLNGEGAGVLTIRDSVDASIIIAALDQYGHRYINTCQSIMDDPECDPMAGLIIANNCVTVTERITAMLDSAHPTN